MTKALKRKPKGVVIEELTELCLRGRALLQRPTDEMLDMAELTVDKLEWILAILQTLPQMSRGIQVVADFNRAGNMGKQVFCTSLEEERTHFDQTVGAQVDVLEKAVTKWRQSNTRPLA
ncbi:MAG: hypothetical protein JWM80_4673 [Cyanobacteria bacterium RYN_339]|nr:hypothetical protein [Cyanobacteria bacterium RYN_339]